MNQITTKRAVDRRVYRAARLRYLADHPYDQVLIAELGLDEAAVISGNSGRGFVPRANQIHHRNKANGVRLLDERWWMATSRNTHEMIESRKGWAREKGYLLPIQADIEGKWGDGNQALTTDELMKSCGTERTNRSNDGKGLRLENELESYERCQKDIKVTANAPF